MINVVCENTRMQWVLPNKSKQAPVHIICFILTTLKNEQHPLKHVRFYSYGALENSTYVTNLLVDDFNTSMETTGAYESWINENNERQNKIFHNMVAACLLDINQHENKWCCEA